MAITIAGGGSRYESDVNDKRYMFVDDIILMCDEHDNVVIPKDLCEKLGYEVKIMWPNAIGLCERNPQLMACWEKIVEGLNLETNSLGINLGEIHFKNEEGLRKFILHLLQLSELLILEDSAKTQYDYSESAKDSEAPLAIYNFVETSAQLRERIAANPDLRWIIMDDHVPVDEDESTHQFLQNAKFAMNKAPDAQLFYTGERPGSQEKEFCAENDIPMIQKWYVDELIKFILDDEHVFENLIEVAASKEEADQRCQELIDDDFVQNSEEDCKGMMPHTLLVRALIFLRNSGILNNEAQFVSYERESGDYNHRLMFKSND